MQGLSAKGKAAWAGTSLVVAQTHGCRTSACVSALNCCFRKRHHAAQSHWQLLGYVPYSREHLRSPRTSGTFRWISTTKRAG
jgi:hypothetical protein